ncbi:hypothetical protein ACIGFK_37145 [Streptomyces sp. NPDC085524]|uniref:hypothetical protein n=1 Tax=unclassified Streptomyces TaxID=2593676 RepID=UPI0035DAA50A
MLLDRATDSRLKLISEDEARAVMVLLGILGDQTRSGEIREAAEELRCRLGSRLGAPAAPYRPAPWSGAGALPSQDA